MGTCTLIAEPTDGGWLATIKDDANSVVGSLCARPSLSTREPFGDFGPTDDGSHEDVDDFLYSLTGIAMDQFAMFTGSKANLGQRLEFSYEADI